MSELFTGKEPTYTISWLLSQIEALQAEIAYLHTAIDSLAAMSDGDSGGPNFPGNLQGKAKA